LKSEEAIQGKEEHYQKNISVDGVESEPKREFCLNDGFLEA